jgi:hypothetical protein
MLINKNEFSENNIYFFFFKIKDEKILKIKKKIFQIE